MKAYNHLTGYLYRWTVLRINRLHIRLHKIVDEDQTPFLHNHPFHYISFIIKGGYDEQVLENGDIKTYSHSWWSVIQRRASVFHRIKRVKGPTWTLFITWCTDSNWELKQHPSLDVPDRYAVPLQNGVYRRTINGAEKYHKFCGFWCIGHLSYDAATAETRPSVHQVGNWT